MLYWPTLQDMLGTLPPDEMAELLALVGRAGAGEAAETQPGDTP